MKKRLLKRVSSLFLKITEFVSSDLEDFRKISYVRAACRKTISGHGTDGYLEAMDFLTGGCADAGNA